MSWFKRGNVRQDSRQTESPDPNVSRDRNDTDPQTCLEVFRNHWQQACSVIENKKDVNSAATDDIDTVIHNFEHMVTLLVGEEGIDGMPGPILHFLLEKDVFDKFCSWNVSARETLGKLRYEQLRMFELAINQSKQLLLIHKPVIRPLMKLLTSCTDPGVKSEDIEYRTVLVLHQICVCISQQTVILESFFNTNADHGPARFLIFSLLIPFIHREGPIGQNARDALLLLMALSAKHPHIGQYTADSDFCPVLATGLSGLYSSLPRKITPPTDDWYMLTEDDIARIPDLQMFLNSLEFCNAVVQIAHPLVKEQLIKYIYDGFLVPVLGPALHQDIPGLPLPLLDTGMFANSREEVMTATAYLDLFLRRITEPVLIRAVLKFVLLEKNDEIVILDSLVTRINSSSRLSLVSLALFKTLVGLNCEDVMFQLVFKYLIPCTHVMVSQRRSVKDLDLYSKSAEKFLSLRPACCTSASTDSPKSTHSLDKTPPSARNSTPEVLKKSPATPNSPDPRKEDFETSYFEYLHEARHKLSRCARACKNWSAPYNGEVPPPDCFLDDNRQKKDEDTEKKDSGSTVSEVKGPEQTEKDGSKSSSVKLLSHGNLNGSLGCVSQGEVTLNGCSDSSFETSDSDVRNTAGDASSSSISLEKCNNVSHNQNSLSLSELYSSLQSIDSFISFLQEVEPSDEMSCSSIEESIQDLDTVLSNMSANLSASSIGNDTTLNFSLSSSEGGSPGKASVNTTRSNTDVPCSLHLRDMSSYVEITMSGLDSQSSAQKMLQDMPTQRSLSLSAISPSPTELSLPLSNRWGEDVSLILATSPSAASASRSFQPRYSNSAPNVGPFLSGVFAKLESMMQNSLYMNLLLTGIVAQLAAYPHPLLRSFLLNHNLVFQPTVKSLAQVLSSMRQKVDSYSFTVPNFDELIVRARKNLIAREESYFSARPVPASLGSTLSSKPVRAATISEVQAIGKEKRSPSQSLKDLLFRRPGDKQKGKSPLGKGKGAQLQRVPGGMGYLFINRQNEETRNSPEESRKTWNAVYCAVILEEFLKELAALAQEHSVLGVDEGAILRIDS